MFAIFLLLKCLNSEALPSSIRQQTIAQPIISQKSSIQQSNIEQSSIQQSTKDQFVIQQQQQSQQPNTIQRNKNQSTRSSNDARIIFPTDNTIILSNSTQNHLINKNMIMKNTTRSLKNIDSVSNSSTIDNLALPVLGKNGKPVCLNDSSFYCEDESNYPK